MIKLEIELNKGGEISFFLILDQKDIDIKNYLIHTNKTKNMNFFSTHI